MLGTMVVGLLFLMCHSGCKVRGDSTGPPPENRTAENSSEAWDNTAATTEGVETSGGGGADDTPLWQVYFDRMQVTVCGIGYLANMVTLVSLMRNGKTFSPAICLLLKHQSFLDSGVCLMAAILILQPFMWNCGVRWFDAVMCYMWHTQEIYWFTVFVSVWNLVLISAERYLAVCIPFSHADLTLRKLWKWIACLYPFSLVCSILNVTTCVFDYDADLCAPGLGIEGQAGLDVLYGFAISCLFSIYLIPCMVYVVMYGRILYTLKARTKNTKLAASKVVAKASDSMAKSAIALTLIFIFSIGFELWYFTLGNVGVFVIGVNNPLQKIGVFMAVFNSCVNPFVYAVLMPAYRLSVKKTFFCATDTAKPPPGSSTASSSLGSTATVSAIDVAPGTDKP